MLSAVDIEFAKLNVKCKKAAIDSIFKCYFPGCTNASINSHILQKNGILSKMTGDSHLWEHTIDVFKEDVFVFKRNGINKLFSFKCFCNDHDSSIFEKIEKYHIDFDDYKSCLLFTIRTLYNEMFRKQVNVKVLECYMKENNGSIDNQAIIQQMRQENLGIQDLKLLEKDIWNDLSTNSESFVFEYREMPKIGICLSSFFTYDTTHEIQQFKSKNGKDMEATSEIFINLFPYGESEILLMGYNKRDENKLKGYFYSFFREKDKYVQRYLTNLILFRCETWVASESFYRNSVESIERCFKIATDFSINNINERRNFDLNIYKSDFKSKFATWSEEIILEK